MKEEKRKRKGETTKREDEGKRGRGEIKGEESYKKGELRGSRELRERRGE